MSSGNMRKVLKKKVFQVYEPRRAGELCFIFYGPGGIINSCPQDLVPEIYCFLLQDGVAAGEHLSLARRWVAILSSYFIDLSAWK